MRGVLRPWVLTAAVVLPWAAWASLGGAGGCAAPARAPAAAPASSSSGRSATDAEQQAFLAYIRRSWSVLGRDHRALLEAAVDPKLPPGTRPTLYVPIDEPLPALRAGLQAELAALGQAEQLARVDLRTLPAVGEPSPPGLLYLPRPYVVPGGRFNEMYGWDSYFIALGLVRDGELARARDLVDNFVYEVERYGKVLNANRSYYLTRSQPPLLAPMILAVWQAGPRGAAERAWVARALPAVERYHAYFLDAAHRTPSGLSRYHAGGEGPAPEVVAGERDAQGLTHYDRVRAYYKAHSVPDYDVGELYDAASDRLTARFYEADRTMRESGFDPSERFGPFNAGVLDYEPVCLNSLLYLTEVQLAELLRLVGRASEAPAWEARAQARRALVNERLWDAAEGLYLDRDYRHERLRRYPFLTTFFPLWVGIATPEQARRVAERLSLFEAPGGLRTSTHVSGNQWDAPYGWAPLQLVAVDGLRRYGQVASAERVAAAFVGTVLAGFLEHGAIFEKYDVERRRADVAAGLRFGYTSNEIGFGWTNAVVLELLAGLSPDGRASARVLPAAPVK